MKLFTFISLFFFSNSLWAVAYAIPKSDPKPTFSSMPVTVPLRPNGGDSTAWRGVSFGGYSVSAEDSSGQGLHAQMRFVNEEGFGVAFSGYTGSTEDTDAAGFSAGLEISPSKKTIFSLGIANESASYNYYSDVESSDRFTMKAGFSYANLDGATVNFVPHIYAGLYDGKVGEETIEGVELDLGASLLIQNFKVTYNHKINSEQTLSMIGLSLDF